MSDTSQLPPEAQLFQTLFGFMVARTLSAVAELNVPDALRDGPRHYTDLARAVGADQRSLHRTMRMLASTGVFAEPQPGTFALTPVSTLLRSDIPGSMRDMAVMITAESHRDEPSCPRSVVDAGYTPAVRTRVGRRAGQHGCERAVVTAPDVLGPPGPAGSVDKHHDDTTRAARPTLRAKRCSPRRNGRYGIRNQV